MPSPPVWDFLCFKSSLRHCSALQSTLAALLTSILQQRFSSNIHAGSSNGLALTLFSLRHRRIPSLFFSSSSWIQTVRPYHGCHRYRTSWDSILWVFDGPLVPQEPTALVAGQGFAQLSTCSIHWRRHRGAGGRRSASYIRASRCLIELVLF